MGVVPPNQPPSILWPAPPGLPAGAHIWVVGGSLAPANVWCELVAADHVVPLTRHAIAVEPRVVERLAPASTLALGRQYQLRVRSAGRSDIVAVWTVGDPAPPAELTRCALTAGPAVEVSVRGVAIVQVVGAAPEVVTGDAVIVAPPETRRVRVRVLGVDGATLAERELAIP